MRHALIIAVLLAPSFACNDPDRSQAGEGESTEGASESGESGEDAETCDEVVVQPTGCDDVEFPGDEVPRTEGVVLGYEHTLFVSGPQALIQFDDESGFACGDVCRCENEAYILALHNHFEGPGEFSLGEESPVGVYGFFGRTFNEEKGVCSYMYEEATTGTVNILSVGEACVAGIISGLEFPYDEINGAFMAGTCD